MNILEYLKKRGIDTLGSDFYRKIDVWESWYRANVSGFHAYRVYNGKGGYTRCRRKSLGMAKKICEDVADLLLNEHVSITVDDAKTAAFVENVFEQENFAVLGNECQERKAACGTVAYVPYLSDITLDGEGRVLTGDVKIDVVTAQNIYPTAWTHSHITEVVFTFAKVWKNKKYIQFQHHRLENGLYMIENSVVEEAQSGRELLPEQWNEIPHFKGLVPKVETGSDKPQFVIDRLNIVNNVDRSNPMGIAIYANSLDTLEKLDLEYDSCANEFLLGRKRIFVAPELLTDENGDQVFDPADSVFYMLPDDYFRNTHEAMREVNMELRVDEHENAINHDLSILSFKCGFGTQYYRFERGALATATQVISEHSDLYRTVRKHEISLENTLRELVRIIIRLGITAGYTGLREDADIIINFDDSIIEDKATERAEDRKDVSMGAMRLDEYRAKWYGETEEVAASKLPEQTAGVMI